MATGRIQCGAFSTGTGILDISGDANVDVLGIFVGINATNTGTVSIAGEAVVETDEFEVRNGSVTQSGETSDVWVTNRLYVGGTQTVSNTATYTISEGILTLPATNIIGNGNAGNATFNIQGGTITTTDRLRVGVGKSDGTLTPTNLVNQTGGDVSITGRLDIGQNAGTDQHLSDIRWQPDCQLECAGRILQRRHRHLHGQRYRRSGCSVRGHGRRCRPCRRVVHHRNQRHREPARRHAHHGSDQGRQRDTADQTLVLNGGTIRARTGGTTLIAGNVTTTSLLSGGITFDTDGLNVNTAAIMTGPGGITKKGAGTLTVNNIQAYTGATRVEAGTLQLTQPYLADNGDVYLYTGVGSRSHLCGS